MRLAIDGGTPAIRKKFKKYNPIGIEERKAADRVMKSGVLSGFVGGWCEEFLGGPEVRAFEEEWAKAFSVRHAVAVNSWTSGLICAVGAIGISPGDEVIVPPWTMCASATAILHWGGVPVFADITVDDYCLDMHAVEKVLSAKTKAIMSVDVFGRSADMDKLNDFASANDLKIISDSAQSPFAKYKNKLAGTIADIGGYSLNFHKHIHTGEGGVIVTNCKELALRARLIRNHAEAAIVGSEVKNLENMIGYNFRLGELECAIGREQLKKLDILVKNRIAAAEGLIQRLSKLQGLALPKIGNGGNVFDNVYYVLPMQLSAEVLATVSRDKVVDALAAEGIEGLTKGYALINELPIFQKRQCYGKSQFPWVIDGVESLVNYNRGICPVAEKLHFETFIGYEICLHDLSLFDIEKIGDAFEKVWAGLGLTLKD